MSVVVRTMDTHDMRSAFEYEEVDRWIRFGLTDSAISHVADIPRETVRDWRKQRPVGQDGPYPQTRAGADCPICSRGILAPAPYAYLLGLYLGDGCLASYPRGVYRLRITLDQRYPSILSECAQAIRSVRPSRALRVGHFQRLGASKSTPIGSTGYVCSHSTELKEARAHDRTDSLAARNRNCRARRASSRADPLRWIPGSQLGEGKRVSPISIQE